MLDIEWLHSFLEVSRFNSLSKASQFLNLTQPALSKQIHNLENYYGVELFKRSTQGVNLTKEGQLFAERIRPILYELDSLKNDLLNVNQLTCLRLGVLPSLAAYYLPQEILKLKKIGIQVEMTVLNTTNDILNSLQMDRIDVGILQKPQTIPKTYWLRDLFKEPFYAIIPAGHPLFTRKVISMADLAGAPLIVHPQQCDIRQCIHRVYDIKNLEPEFALEVDFGESIVGFVKAGAGVSILPEITANQINAANIGIIPIEDFLETRTISLTTRKPTVGKKLYHLLRTTTSN